MLASLFIVVSGILCVSGLVGSLLAFRAHNDYLGARLLALSVATVPAVLYSKRYVAVIAGQSRTTLSAAGIIALLLLVILIAALFPRAIFGSLAGLSKH